ncbi:g11694 [Coccomyxa viridis]|uniref:G11694 protein n=1 Tax=Coccomyxa viridis TaxID=1274662 RepID=A0ABP1GB81_9CHLO
MAGMKEGDDQRPVPKEAPPGLFFTKAAFQKYSALERVKEASAARRHEQPSLPKPLGPLPSSLTRPAQPRASSGGLTDRSRDAQPSGAQDAVVPQLEATDEAASEELASEDIWGDEDADMGMEDESSRPAADSAEEAGPVPKVAVTQGAKSGARKRQSAAPAKGEKAPKRQRAQPKKPQGARKSRAAAKPAAKAAPSNGTDSRKAVRSRKDPKGAGSAGADSSEPQDASEAPSKMQAAKAMFMRTMGLPEPKAFSSSSRGTAKRPGQKQQPATAQRKIRDAAGVSQQASGKDASREAQAQSQPAPKEAAPGSTLQQDVSESLKHPDQQQAQPQLDLEQAHPKAAMPPDAPARPLRSQAPDGVPEPAAIQKSPQLPAAAAALHATEEAAHGQSGGGPVPESVEAPKLEQLLGGSGRPAENGVKLVNLLNPNNPQYNQAFAVEYARMKAAAGKDGGKGHHKQGAKRIYSNLTAQDHAWYLAKQDLRLHGRDAVRMADMSEKVAEEQQQFIRAQWLDAQDAERFRYMDPRVEAQLQAHFQPMREAVRQLPRLWQLQGQLQLGAVLQGTKQAPAMAHLSTPVSSGHPPAFTPPSGHTAVPLDRPYMPKGDSSGASRWLHQDEIALQLAAEKRAAVVMADGAFAELAQTAVQGFAAGWEIPVIVTPSISTGDSQQAPQSNVVVLSDPLLKRALSRREKHELLVAAAILALGRDKSVKQQSAQASDWRKQVLSELGPSAGAKQTQEEEGGAASDQSALRYSLWRLGEHRIITRAWVHAAVQSSPATEHSLAAVVQAKMEYHGNKASDAEEVTAEELVRWWSASHIRPGSHVLVGHVGVHSCQVLRSQQLTAPELLESAAGAGFQPAMTWRLMSAVLGQLTSLPPGQYLLTHQPGSDAVCLFAAALEVELASEAEVAPLPCMTDAAKGTVFDLWGAHTNSGTTDESQLGFIPKMWQPSFPDVPQIPYTFTPRQNPSGKRRGRKGNPKGTAMGTATGTGHILDWDTKPQKTGGSDTNFSAAKYAELLEEDI